MGSASDSGHFDPAVAAAQSGSRREEKKALHRKKIIESAREVFFRDGFKDANLDEVARLAGVAKGTLYRYFENKGELYVAVLVHNGEIFEEKLRESISLAGSIPDQIRAAGRFYLEHWTAHPQYFQIFWALENETLIGEIPEEIMEQVNALWERCLSLLAGLIQLGVEEGIFIECESWEMAHILWTVAHGLIQTENVPSRREFRKVALDRLFTEAIDLFLRGLSPTAKSP